ncbi:MAG: flagellar biosynthetic protein FliR [Planctomycetota bacterium]
MPIYAQLLDDPVLRGLGQWLALVLARLVPLLALTPMLGGQVVPARVRLGAAATLSLVVLLALAPESTPPIAAVPFMLLMIKEAAVGLTLAVVIRVALELLAVVGGLVDAGRTDQQSMLSDPIRQEQSTTLARFLFLGGWTLFLSAGGGVLFIRGLVESFRAIPPTAFAPEDVVNLPTALPVITLVNRMLVAATQIALPVLTITVLVDIALSLLQRVVQQLQTYFIAMAAKPTLGIAALLLTLAASAGLISDWGAGVAEFVQEIITRWTGSRPGGLP